MRATATLLLLVSTLGCQEDVSKMASPSSPLAAIPPAQLEALAGKRIYFGHQSVGYNLVDGLTALAKERPELRLRFVESRAASELRPGTFAHAENGQNVKPLSKIRDFTETLEQGVGASADIAFFKFCYVDFPPGGDVEKVFAEYKAAIARLHERYPNVRFVHVTSPLTTVPSGLKVTIKRILRRGDQRDAQANVLRERFNELMRKEYASREPFFDLAAVEARRPDGSLTTFELDGARHPALSPEYASDEGHLNALGARWAAAHLLAALASAAR